MVVELSMEKSYSNFWDSLKTERTRDVYDAALREFKSWMRSANYDDLSKVEVKLMQEKVIDYIRQLRTKGLAPLTIRLKVAAIKHFLVMNDIVLNWEKVMKFIGGSAIKTRDRIYTKAEIQRILDKCDERKRVMFLILASTGMRIGALPDIKIRDLTKIEEPGVYRLVVYGGDSEEYITFTTIECAKSIDSYLEYRRSKGETIKPTAPLLREQFNGTNSNDAKPVLLNSLKTLLTRTLEDAGVRKHGNDSSKRKEVMRFHGFRKFFNTMLSQAAVKPVIKEMLMGHRVGLEKNYLRPSDNELLSEYLKAVDLITISEEKELQVKVQKLQLQNDQLIDILRTKIAALERANEIRETGNERVGNMHVQVAVKKKRKVK